MAARMVDAQAPGVATALRGLSGAASGGPGRLLAEYALLHLLIRAHERLDQLPDGLAAVVRSRVGYPVNKDDVLARPAVTDQWLVLAVREVTDAAVPGRRIWLRGRQTKRWAMLLTFAAPNGAWQDPGTARLRPGTRACTPACTTIPASRRCARSSAKARRPGAGCAARSGGRRRRPAHSVVGRPRTGPVAHDVADAARRHARSRPARPAARRAGGVRRPGGPRGRQARQKGGDLADGAGAALPLADRESLWTLLAVSGGQPVTVAGEWHPDGLVALTTWHGDQAVTL